MFKRAQALQHGMFVSCSDFTGPWSSVPLSAFENIVREKLFILAVAFEERGGNELIRLCRELLLI